MNTRYLFSFTKSRRTLIGSNLQYPGAELRSHRRYVMDLELSYRVLPDEMMTPGRLHEIGSSGIRLTSSRLLAPGKRVKISIAWALGWTTSTAMEIQHHKFCSRKT